MPAPRATKKCLVCGRVFRKYRYKGSNLNSRYCRKCMSKSSTERKIIKEGRYGNSSKHSRYGGTFVW